MSYKHQPLQTYFDEIGQTPLLTANEEKTASKHQLTVSNLRLVVNIAKSFRNRGLGLDDLVQAGNCGLLHAVERFDQTRGVRFSSYATYWIKHSIRLAVMSQTRTIRIPVYLFQMMRTYKRGQAELSKADHTPTHDEVAKHIGLSKRQSEIVRWYAAQHMEPLESEDGIRQDVQERQPEVNSVECEEVLRLVDHLNEQQRQVIRLRFGLSGQPPMTLLAIGKAMGGLCRERIRQIERDGLAQLRAFFFEE